MDVERAWWVERVSETMVVGTFSLASTPAGYVFQASLDGKNILLGQVCTRYAHVCYNCYAKIRCVRYHHPTMPGQTRCHVVAEQNDHPEDTRQQEKDCSPQIGLANLPHQTIDLCVWIC
jgi:hypothetical protein